MNIQCTVRIEITCFAMRVDELFSKGCHDEKRTKIDDRLICSINLWHQKEKELWLTNEKDIFTYHGNSYYLFKTKNCRVGIHIQHKLDNKTG